MISQTKISDTGTEIIYNDRENKNVVDKFAERLDENSFFPRKNITEIKSDKGHEVFEWRFDNSVYFIKNYAYDRYAKRFKNLFRAAEAKRVLKIYKKLLSVKVRVLPIIGAVDYSSSFTFKKSLIISKFIAGVNLEDVFNNIEHAGTRKRALEAFADFKADMFRKNIYNGDPSLSNYFLEKEKGQFELRLMDLDNITEHTLFKKYFIKKSLSKMLAIIYSRRTDMLYSEKQNLLKMILAKLGVNNVNNKYNKIYSHTKKRLKSWGFENIIKQHGELQ